MSGMPFDATMKDLIEENARAWAEYFNPYPVIDVAVIDADLSTVTARADKVLRVTEDDGEQCLLNFEAEARHAGDPKRLVLYSVLLNLRHDLPVRSIVLLLRRSANATVVTGLLEMQRKKEPPYLRFTYEVVPVWSQPLAPLLAGPLGLLPLAPLTDEAEADLPNVVGQVVKRLRTETTREQAGKMETTTLILLGLRYENAIIQQLFREVPEMEESTTYQYIMRRGVTETILRQGRRKFGEPSAEQAQSLKDIANNERLQQLADRILDATSWQELLSCPPPPGPQ